VRVESESINGLAGPHWIIEGANVHVRSGSGSTDESCGSNPNCPGLTGLGNLVVGYNEPFRNPPAFPRTGSNNLIIGPENGYTSFGGLVAGRQSRISGESSLVTGGASNQASGHGSSVSGGFGNVASGMGSSASGE
jgi:hypothetical protein